MYLWKASSVSATEEQRLFIRELANALSQQPQCLLAARYNRNKEFDDVS